MKKLLVTCSLLVVAALTAGCAGGRQQAETPPTPQQGHQSKSARQQTATRLREQAQAAREQNPDDPKAYILEARAEVTAGNPVAAQQALETALAKDPNSFEALYLLGKSLQAQDNYAEAEAAYRKAFAVKADYLSPSLALADLLAQQGKLADAAAVLEAAAAAKPAPAVLLPLARYYEQMGQQEKAVATYQQVLTADPENPVAKERLSSLQGS